LTVENLLTLKKRPMWQLYLSNCLVLNGWTATVFNNGDVRLRKKFGVGKGEHELTISLKTTVISREMFVDALKRFCDRSDPENVVDKFSGVV